MLHMAFYGAAMLVAVSGVGFLAIAAYLFLDQILFQPLAALVAGAGMLIAALLFTWTFRRIFTKRNSRLPEPVSSNRVESELSALLGNETASWLKKHGKEASLAAFALGVASGLNPRLRRTLITLAKDVGDLLEDLPSGTERDD